VALFVAVPFTAVHAYKINFDDLRPFNNYDHIPAGYGSTADTAVSYQILNANFSQFLDYAEIWNTGYGNLNTAAFAGSNGKILCITLTATNTSQSVVLNSFDVAAYPTSNFIRKADIFEVIDGNGNVLINYGDFYISGLVAQTLNPDVEANFISILLGYDWNKGINHINYSLSSSAVPIPATIFLFGPTFAGLGLLRRRFKN